MSIVQKIMETVTQFIRTVALEVRGSNCAGAKTS